MHAGLQKEVDRLKVEFRDIKSVISAQLDKATDHNSYLQELRRRGDTRMSGDNNDGAFRWGPSLTIIAI